MLKFLRNTFFVAAASAQVHTQAANHFGPNTPNQTNGIVTNGLANLLFKDGYDALGVNNYELAAGTLLGSVSCVGLFWARISSIKTSNPHKELLQASFLISGFYVTAAALVDAIDKRLQLEQPPQVQGNLGALRLAR